MSRTFGGDSVNHSMHLRKHYLKTAQNFINDGIKQKEERRLKLVSEMEASRTKIEFENQDPWAYNDESDGDEVVV